MLDSSLAFWRNLSTEVEQIATATLLANLEAPFLLGNAAWHLDSSQLSDAESWYRKRNLPPAVILNGSEDALENELRAGGFTLERSFVFETVSSEVLPGDTGPVEQVNWAQGRTLGEILAVHYGAPSFGLQMGRALTKALERDARIRAYLAYDPEPSGAMLTFDAEEGLLAMLLAGSGALRPRLCHESGGRPVRVLTVLEERSTSQAPERLERWSKA